MTPEQRKNYEHVNNVVEKYLADGVDMDLCQIRYYALKELCDTIREQESEIKAGTGMPAKIFEADKLFTITTEQEAELQAGAHMLAKMHDKNLDLEAEIARITQNAIRILNDKKRYVVGNQYTGQIVTFDGPNQAVFARPMTLKQAMKFTGEGYVILELCLSKEQPDETK